MKTKKYLFHYGIIFIVSLFLLSACSDMEQTEITNFIIKEDASGNITSLGSNLPSYHGKPYIEINQNIPFFHEDEFVTEPFEKYSQLDDLGRCGTAYANICSELMPTEKRGEIGMIKPSGWHTVKYQGIDGNYLYNRCHLIAFQLAGENDNEENLITGTRSMNTEMIPFENMVADYVKETGHHVLYRVTPIYENDNLLASGVLMEAQSVEDDEICFNVFLFNVQEGITLNYATGESKLSEKTSEKPESTLGENEHGITYILNNNTKKFHRTDCSSVQKIKAEHKEEYDGNKDDLIKNGYEPCKLCNP